MGIDEKIGYIARKKLKEEADEQGGYDEYPQRDHTFIAPFQIFLRNDEEQNKEVEEHQSSALMDKGVADGCE